MNGDGGDDDTDEIAVLAELAAWAAERQADYAALRADWRPRVEAWLEERELPGTPRTAQPGGDA